MAASSWRTAHGKSKKHGRLVASEAVPADELRAATGSDTAGRDRDSQGRFRKGNRAAAAKRIKAGPGGALAKLAASLISQARGCERDAWELASREAEARNKGEDSRLARYLRGDLENDR